MSEIADRIGEEYEGALIMDDYDECIMGVCNTSGYPRVVYNTEMVIENLISQGMSHEEAIEFHDFNQVGAYVGESTPIFVDTSVTEDQ